ncbi:hypothetical protein [Methylocella silvestris]|uniref:hypothetical protein n=1 Tax=Methylocella silvestris TaxID=199596 RepID=UPI0011AF5B8F|nr:hypothetical protein [Methylocella silvestris]
MTRGSYALGRRLRPVVTEADCNELIDMMSLSLYEAPPHGKGTALKALVNFSRAKIAVLNGAQRTARKWIERGVAELFDGAAA